MENSKKKTQFIVMAMVVLIVLTRALTISHNMELHADEHVFYTAAQSLKGYLSGSSPIYEEVKEYPEGAIVMQLPFHIMTAVINRLFNCSITPQLSGRIAAVFYFTAGAVLGCIILYRYFSQKPLYMMLYSLILVFSIRHIIQSRYGTADAITLFLLMAVLLLTAESMTRIHCYRYLFAAFFAAGALGASKYPLFFFAAIPVYGMVVLFKQTAREKRILITLAALAFLYFGFAVLSPKAAFDPMYIWRASTREIGAYMASGGTSLFEAVWTRFMSILTYSMLYSGFPLAPIFFIIGARYMRLACDKGKSAQRLFAMVIPILTAIFFTYNLFVSLLVFRTYYPFFFISDLYAVMAIGRWAETGKIKRFAVCLLTVIMLARSIYFIYLLSDRNDKTHVAELISNVVDDEWSTTTILSGYVILPDDYNTYPGLSIIDSDDERFLDSEGIALTEGELFIAGARDFTVYSRCFNFLPSLYDDNVDSLSWIAFRNANSQYYAGALYPDYIYYLFGYWLMGNDGCYEFPAFRVFYRA